jgi:FkbM family methyltransferase
MDFRLVLVGAHDGSGLEKFVREAESKGRVLLIEPVPFLFKKLQARFAKSAKVVSRNIALSTKDGAVAFTAPKQTANSVLPYGDKLGSMVSDHAAGHDARMSQHVEVINIPASSFETLIKAENISSIHTLFTDTEGMDAELLLSFPFSIIVPKLIIFEFKHADGLFRVGRKFARLLNLLEDRGYRVSVIGAENMLATHESFTG